MAPGVHGKLLISRFMGGLEQSPIPAVAREVAEQLSYVAPRHQLNRSVDTSGQIGQAVLQIVARAELLR